MCLTLMSETVIPTLRAPGPGQWHARTGQVGWLRVRLRPQPAQPQGQ
jgi:hypothetical protein